jgi:hypothetical protein
MWHANWKSPETPVLGIRFAPHDFLELLKNKLLTFSFENGLVGNRYKTRGGACRATLQ